MKKTKTHNVLCKSYWNTNDVKTLIVEKEFYPAQNPVSRFEKREQYYKKGQGLFKIEVYGKSDSKILMEYKLSDSVIDLAVDKEDFPLVKNT